MPAFMRAVICKYTPRLRCSEKNAVVGEGTVLRASRPEEGCCDSERVGRVGCSKGGKQISDSNIDGLAWRLHHQTFLRLWSYSASSVFVVDPGRGQVQKSWIFQERLLAFIWHHKFPRVAQTSLRPGSWGQGGDVALERSTVDEELWRCGNLKEGDAEV